MKTESTPVPEHKAREARKVVAASFIGTTFEWHDFFIYASAAALVFEPLSLPTASEFAGTLAAFGTLPWAFWPVRSGA